MATTELDKLKRKRTTLKGLCTKIINSITMKLNEPDLNVQEIELLREKLLIKEKEILDVETKIESLIDDLDELQKELESREEYRDQIIELKIQLMNKIEKVKAPNNESRNASQQRAENSRTEITNKNSVKLPKIVIPHYDGSPENWQEFWSQFDITVNQNNALSKVEKFVYLRSLLKPPALTVIQGLALSEANYETALDLIKNRFGKKDIIVRYKIDALLNLSPVKSVNQIKELRLLHDAP